MKLRAVLSVFILCATVGQAAKPDAAFVARRPARPPRPEVVKPPEAPVVLGPFELGLQLGALVPTAGNGLRTSPVTTLKLGYLLSDESQLQALGEFSYSAPTVARDAQVVTVNDVGLAVGLSLSVVPRSWRWVPWVATGVRLNLLSVTQARGIGVVPTYSESGASGGGFVSTGVGLRVGRGHLTAEVAYNVLWVNQQLTGAGSASSLSMLVGYSLSF
jgi:hypothetical protein